jgi:RNA polymerase sigma-70 factor (ECF subfamily)
VITRRKTIDLFKRFQEVGVGGSSAQERFAEVPALEDESESDELKALENGILYRRGIEMIESAFEPKTRQAFWLLANGQSASEVAERLGLNVAAVYTAKSKILKRLKQEFRGLLDADRPRVS